MVACYVHNVACDLNSGALMPQYACNIVSALFLHLILASFLNSNPQLLLSHGAIKAGEWERD